jgi:hypothetical protein
MLFAESDRRALQGLRRDPSAQPSFELIKSCLIWPDERPITISNNGYTLLGGLWIVRGFIHRNIPSDRWGLDPGYFQELWRNALAEVPEWPGFGRLTLSPTDQEYLALCLRQASESVDY